MCTCHELDVFGSSHEELYAVCCHDVPRELNFFISLKDLRWQTCEECSYRFILLSRGLTLQAAHIWAPYVLSRQNILSDYRAIFKLVIVYNV
eukprot:2385904-Ditylum_brightwellii.AAC.1